MTTKPVRPAVVVTRRDAIATITLDRPDKRNALAHDVSAHRWVEIAQVVANHDTDRSIRSKSTKYCSMWARAV